MILFYSGSSYTKVHPETQGLSLGGVMQSYWEVRDDTAGEYKRFKRRTKAKKERRRNGILQPERQAGG